MGNHQKFVLLGCMLFCTFTSALGCASDLDCSLNGICNGGSCICDKPWSGISCGVLAYKTTPISGKVMIALFVGILSCDFFHERHGITSYL
eukprot:m.828600 g.828600  ORF g.828600 m.828600 type:complete len:91 (+) comp23419_c1_seq65:204-476(+)